MNACLWQKMNRTMIDFAESKTLSEFLTDCRQQLTGEWDLYEI